MPTILEEIVEQTKIDLNKRKKKVSVSDFDSFETFEGPRRKFSAALREADPLAVIAEVKKASPSKGVIREDFEPKSIAVQYEKGGASAISVLTDEPAFQGSLEYLKEIRDNTSIPLLRKDFIIDPYQVKEARAYGADAVLFIATITDGHQLQELHHAATEYELECLVECYSEEDMELVDFDYVTILGVNNRDLHTFEVDLHRGISLLQSAPGETVLVSESGLSSTEDLKLLVEAGIDAALVGEYFMRQEHPGEAVSGMLDKLNTELQK